MTSWMAYGNAVFFSLVGIFIVYRMCAGRTKTKREIWAEKRDY